jgi:hypothetical protein
LRPGCLRGRAVSNRHTVRLETTKKDNKTRFSTVPIVTFCSYCN